MTGKIALCEPRLPVARGQQQQRDRHIDGAASAHGGEPGAPSRPGGRFVSMRIV